MVSVLFSLSTHGSSISSQQEQKQRGSLQSSWQDAQGQDMQKQPGASSSVAASALSQERSLTSTIAIVRIPGDDCGSIYLCEDGGHHPGLYVQTESSQVYTILQADKDQFKNVEEMTGIAFSPDARHLYVLFQHAGIIYNVTRDDMQLFKDTLNTQIE